MKLVPHAVTRKLAMTALHAKKDSPQFLFGLGMGGMVVSTVLACRATLKLEETLEEVQKDLYRVDLVHETMDARRESYSENDRRKQVAVIYLTGIGSITRLYGPSVLVGFGAAVCLTKSHHILQDRNAGLAAAYTACDQAFKKYRSNVVESAGVESDQFLRYETEECELIDDSGNKTVGIRINRDANPSMYARVFDQINPNWAEESEYNMAWLRHKQDWHNHLLSMRGYLFLNEVYEDLGVYPTEAGEVVGWFLGNGDGFVDYGIFDGERTNDFVNGREASVLLDFNVDGAIYHLMDQIDHNKKRGFTPWQR